MERYIPQEAMPKPIDVLRRALETGVSPAERERARTAGDSAKQAVTASPEAVETLMNTA